MPPRKSDAASRKSDAGGTTAAADIAMGETTTMTASTDGAATTAITQASTLAEMAGAANDASGSAALPTAPATASAAGDGGKDGKDSNHKDHSRRESRGGDALTIEDLNLPRSILTRLAKGVLPPNTQIQGSAVTAMSKSATVFISHLANAANTITTNAGKKTIMPTDVFAALDDIEFDFMRSQLEAEFSKFSHIQTSKRSDYRKRIAAAKKVSSSGAGEDHAAETSALDSGDTTVLSTVTAEGNAAAVGDSSRDAPPQAKKAKRTHGANGAVSTAEAEEDGGEDEEAVGGGEGDDHENERGQEEDEEEDEDDEDDDDEDDDGDDGEDEDEESNGGDVDDHDGVDDRGHDDEALDSDASD